MAGLRIPPEYVRGFLEIRELDEAEEQELLAALESEPPTFNRPELQARLLSTLPDTDPDHLERIMETMTTLYALRDNTGLSTPDFAEAVCDAMNASSAEELVLDDEERGFFTERLIRLLSVDTLEVAARAADLLGEHAHTMHGPARVFSDVRPIFGPDPEDPPRGAVVVHTLKITYHEGREVKEFFIALDSKEVDELIGVLGRASLKGESLKRMLGEAGLPHIDAT
jgi:hypothetical protein